MRQITVQDDGVTITVSAANVRMGAKRALLRNAGMESLTSETMSDAEKVLAFAVYPDLISAAVEYQGMTEPSFDAFCELPETLFNPWMEAVYSLNPHWQMTPAQIDEAEKKISSIVEGLSVSSNQPMKKKRRNHGSTRTKAMVSG